MPTADLGPPFDAGRSSRAHAGRIPVGSDDQAVVPERAYLRRGGTLLWRKRVSLLHLLPFILLIVLGITALRVAPVPGYATTIAFPPPALTNAWPTEGMPETVTLLGVHFAPGGTVEVLVYDQSGTELTAAGWVTASTTIWGPPTGYTPGGAVRAVVSAPCCTPIRIRAYDQQSSRWSNWLAYEPPCSGCSAVDLSTGIPARGAGSPQLPPLLRHQGHALVVRQG